MIGAPPPGYEPPEGYSTLEEAPKIAEIMKRVLLAAKLAENSTGADESECLNGMIGAIVGYVVNKTAPGTREEALNNVIRLLTVNRDRIGQADRDGYLGGPPVGRSVQ
jgi:hypothetical protein